MAKLSTLQHIYIYIYICRSVIAHPCVAFWPPFIVKTQGHRQYFQSIIIISSIKQHKSTQDNVFCLNHVDILSAERHTQCRVSYKKVAVEKGLKLLNQYTIMCSKTFSLGQCPQYCRKMEFYKFKPIFMTTSEQNAPNKYSPLAKTVSNISTTAKTS